MDIERVFKTGQRKQINYICPNTLGEKPVNKARKKYMIVNNLVKKVNHTIFGKWFIHTKSDTNTNSING